MLKINYIITILQIALLLHAVPFAQLGVHVHQVQAEPQVEVIEPLLLRVQYTNNTGHHQPHQPHHQPFVQLQFQPFQPFHQLLLIVQALTIDNADI